MDDSRMHKNVMGGFFGRRTSVAKPRGRWEGAVGKDWNATERE
jgi:hypothetical protein